MSALYILPFDHRGSFQKMILGHKNALTQAEMIILKYYKKVIFDGFKAVANERGKEKLGILVDEEYGKEIHAEAKNLGIRNALTVEKSGKPEFDFEYPDWQNHVAAIRPTYIKALVRVVNGENHGPQNQRLAILNDYCEKNGYKFLLEPLVFPSESDLTQFGGDRKKYDLELRPQHFAKAAAEFHAAGVKPDVWKIEGTETTGGMDICSEAVFNGGKPNPEIVILGRGESDEKVDQWLTVGAKSHGVTGFAVGRTIFAQPLIDMYAEKITERQAVEAIAKKFIHFIDVFEKTIAVSSAA